AWGQPATWADVRPPPARHPGWGGCRCSCARSSWKPGKSAWASWPRGTSASSTWKISSGYAPSATYFTRTTRPASPTTSSTTGPAPELALVISPRLKVVGYTVGNDMSARDIEGENPLYLPQAKVYDHSCALGPLITLTDAMPPLDRVAIRLTIERRGATAFEG